MDIILEEKDLLEREEAFDWLHAMLPFDWEWGNNLDALHDVLTSAGKLTITFIESKEKTAFSRKLLHVFEESEYENPEFTFVHMPEYAH